MFSNARIVSKRTSPLAYRYGEQPRGTPGFVQSSSSLREFLRCPRRWKNGYESPDSESKTFGSLLDCLALTPEQFDSRYALEPSSYRNEKGEDKAWSNNANVCKAWHAEQGDREVIKVRQLAEAQAAANALADDEIISAWTAASETQVFVSADWTDKRTGLVIPCRCLIDYAPKADSEFAGALGDLKTTRSGALSSFQRWVYSAGYHVQAAFNLDLWNAATGESRTDWCFVVLENFAPWEPGRRLLSQDFIDMGRATYRLALSRYAACVASGVWPGYDDSPETLRDWQGWSTVKPEPWMALQSLSDSMTPPAPTEEQPSDPNDFTP